MITQDLGIATAYGYAKSKGYTGTEAEFAELMADYAKVGQRAEDAAESALNSKTAAQTAATTATNKASEATTAAQTATTKAGEAQTSAQTASSKASEASQSASQASGYAQTAETAKTDAQTAKTQADTARDEAVTAKTAAETAQGKAEDAQAAAESVAESIPSDYSQLAEDVSDLKEDLTNRVIDVDSLVVKGLDVISTAYRGLHPSTGLPFETGSSGYHIRKANVTPGKEYLLAASTRGRSPSCIYTFFNSSDEVVLKGPNSDAHDETTIQNFIDVDVIAPVGASYILVADYFDPNDYNTGVIGTVREVIQAIPSIRTEIAEHAFVNNYFIDITSELTVEAGYLDTQGKVVEYANAETTDLLEINKYIHYVVTGSPLYSSNALWAIYDSNLHVLYVYKNNTFEYDYDFNCSSILEDYPTAKYVRFSSVFQASGIHLIVKRSSYIDEACTYSINNINSNKWLGKKWVCIGDSLTEANSRTTKHYYDYISEITGITAAINAGSGSGYKNPSSVDNKTFYQRASEIPTDADVVTVFGSGNDLTHGYSLGEVTDTGTNTICGCINTTLDALIARIPTIQLGIVAPTPWVNFPPSTVDNAMEQYVEALQAICANRSIPFLDLYHCSNLRPWTAEGREACYSKDDGNGVHPDENGHKLIAPRFKGFLETLLL